MSGIKVRKKARIEGTSGEELWTGKNPELLKALHLVTRDGQINADARRKLKQIYHLTQLIEPVLKSEGSFHLLDVGAGKSYLGFLLYDLCLSGNSQAWVSSIESRADLVAKTEPLARELGYERMRFIEGRIGGEDTFSKVKKSVDVITALHACDTATDEAIMLGLKLEVKSMALVPCCQAEVAGLLPKEISEKLLLSLYDSPLHRREFGSHLTNVVRKLFLQSRGYRVTVTELTGWEHSLKNELILAEHTGKAHDPSKVMLDEWLERVPSLRKMKLFAAI